jgi:hypothetical protein
MSAKVYVLLDLAHVDGAQVAQILREKHGVTAVDVIEGPPDLLIVVQAPERQMAAEYLMDILESLDGMTENLHVFPVCESAEKKCADIRQPVMM